MSGLREFLEREGVPEVPSALYLSAGSDTMPFTFLSPPFLASHGVEDFVMPELFVYVDRQHPRGSRGGPFGFHDARGTVVRTVAAQQEAIGDHPAWMLDVEFQAQDPEFQGGARVLRVRARNQDVLPLVAQAGWAPDVVITVCDGDAWGGQDRGRCENDFSDPSTAPHFLAAPPKWWVTDHWRPRSMLPYFGDTGPQWEFERVGPLSSEWGHPWRPLHGANLCRVRP